MYVSHNQSASQPIASSSSSLSTSGNLAADFTSSSSTNPILLHPPRQRRTRIDWTDKQLRTCKSMRRPWLKVRSTSTKVAVIFFMSRSIRKHKRSSYLGLTSNLLPSNKDEDRYVSIQTTRPNHPWHQPLVPCSRTFPTHRVALDYRVPGALVNRQRCLLVTCTSNEMSANFVTVSFQFWWPDWHTMVGSVKIGSPEYL